MPTRFANLYLAGAPKCGTTSLASWLARHPRIFAPLRKEPLVFATDLTQDRRPSPQQVADDHFGGWTSEPYALDATTHYFYSRSAPRDIKQASPDARIYVLLRNPAEAAHSMFHQLRFNGTETLESFEESLALEDQRAANLTPIRRGYPENFLYTRVFGYRRNIQNFLQHFDRSAFRILLLEDLKRDPRGVLRSIFEDLGIETGLEDEIDFSPQNTAKKARSRLVQTLATYPPPWIGHVSKSLFSHDQRQRIRNWLQKKNAAPSTNPPLAPETRAHLNALFAEDVTWLEDYLQRDLSHWRNVPQG